MRFVYACAALALSAANSALAAAADDNNAKEKPLKPCTIRSPSSGAFFDLNSLRIKPPDEDARKDDHVESWHARGYDYGHNFTLNFCGPVVEELDDVEGVSKALWKNVSAFYTVGRRTYSIGQQNSELVFRGRKLVLNYTDGSPCDSSNRKRALLAHEAEDIRASELLDGDDDDEDDRKSKTPSKSPSKSTVRRKSSIISLLCEREPMAPKAPQAAVAFVGASQDECTYFFEVRSPAACAGAEIDSSSGLGPGGVFGVIMLIALLVYLVGGCVYQRTVMHQRGWRQLPNYSMWAGICGFITDMFVILTSSCTKFLPRRRGYSRISISANGRPPRGSSDDENRLIDNLDEEWDD